MVNRRLIRPSLAEVNEKKITHRKGPAASRKPVPLEITHAENYYYVKQMQTRTSIVVVLNDGEILRGTIEWYDKYCIKVHRSSGPNLLIYKSAIKYLYKDEDSAAAAPQEELELAHASRDS